MDNTSLISQLCEELNSELAGGSIEKVLQPAKDIIVLIVRNNRKNFKLLISAGSGKARIHITDFSYDSSNEPPMFCMLLRKYILGCRILKFVQLNEDNIIEMVLSPKDDFLRVGQRNLIVEMIGRCPNIVLTDDTDHIIDCIHRRNFRNPGLIYRCPEKGEMIKVLPSVEGSPSEYLDSYYSRKENDELIRSQSKELRTYLNNLIKRTERKIGSRRIELEKTANRDNIRKKAELIISNIYQIKNGSTSFTCQDYFSNNELITIELDPDITPSKYAAKLFKEYNKLKNAELHLTELINEAEAQLDFLLSEQDLLLRAKTKSEINDIRNELISQGFKKNNSKAEKKKSSDSSEPMLIELNSGNRILIGRNNVQNDNLTFRIAKKNDYWFHIKDYHGSHVILQCLAEPSEDDISEAARMAAVHSQANGAGYVDYCLVSDVRKNKGSYPGKVYYSNYRTIKI